MRSSNNPATRKRSSAPSVRTNWDALTEWYDGWVGKEGSPLHRELALPAILDLLAPQAGERILDIGAGQGVLAPYVVRAGASYVGVDASTRLLYRARRYHGSLGTFVQGDACHLQQVAGLRKGSFDGVVFLLSIQDMDPLQSVLEGAAWALRGGGRLVILMIHPCFRVPRQSGWSWHEERQLHYRRIERYLTPLSVPMKEYANGRRGHSLCFHRPLQDYINGLATCGLTLDQMRELSTYKTASGPHAAAENRAYQEIPQFLALRAYKR